MPLFSSSREMLNKAESDFRQLKKNKSPENAFNFFVTIYHIKDHVVVEFPKAALLIAGFPHKVEWELCSMLCNEAKHAVLSSERNAVFKRNPSYQSRTEYERLAGNKALDLDGSGFLDPEYRLYILLEGVTYDAIQVGERLIANWLHFFQNLEAANAPDNG